MSIATEPLVAKPVNVEIGPIAQHTKWRNRSICCGIVALVVMGAGIAILIANIQVLTAIVLLGAGGIGMAYGTARACWEHKQLSNLDTFELTLSPEEGIASPVVGSSKSPVFSSKSKFWFLQFTKHMKSLPDYDQTKFDQFFSAEVKKVISEYLSELFQKTSSVAVREAAKGCLFQGIAEHYKQFKLPVDGGSSMTVFPYNNNNGTKLQFNIQDQTVGSLKGFVFVMTGERSESVVFKNNDLIDDEFPLSKLSELPEGSQHQHLVNPDMIYMMGHVPFKLSNLASLV